MENQQEIDRIVKKTSAKYLKKLEEKENELGMYREALDSISQVAVGNAESYAEPKAVPSDDEIINTVESILSTPENERSDGDRETLLQLKEQYGNALFKKDLDDAKAWAEENYEGSIDELLQNEEFLQFADGINAALPNIIQKYVALKATSKPPVSIPVATPGSARDTSGAQAKQYFSKEEVDKMNRAEIKKYLPVIQKSIPKW